ncbi:hypothetical protein ACFLXE_04785 [Chloroflexota bacterium]
MSYNRLADYDDFDVSSQGEERYSRSRYIKPNSDKWWYLSRLPMAATALFIVSVVALSQADDEESLKSIAAAL